MGDPRAINFLANFFCTIPRAFSSLIFKHDTSAKHTAISALRQCFRVFRLCNTHNKSKMMFVHVLCLFGNKLHHRGRKRTPRTQSPSGVSLRMNDSAFVRILLSPLTKQRLGIRPARAARGVAFLYSNSSLCGYHVH